MFITGVITYINLGKPLFNLIKEREGLNKKTFIMYKFRTKIVCKETKYTKLSYFFDKFRLNESPQLFNILKGDMSFIGPRPFIPNDILPEGTISKKRYLVRPGITGLAQINGGRYLSHKEKLKYDIIYYDNFSFKQDITILIKTFTRFFDII